MSKVTGFVVRLSVNRQQLFDDIYSNGQFAEPVPEFEHSRYVPLICFFLNACDQVTHIGNGKRGNSAGTGLRRLNFSNIVSLNNKVPLSEICESVSMRIKKVLENKLKAGGLLPPRSFEEMIQAVIHLAPETAPILKRYSVARANKIAALSENSKVILAEQKEAVVTALSLAGIDKDQLLGWDFEEDQKPESFLDGLSQVRLREDPMVINDQMKIPGFEVVKTTPHSSVVFQNDMSVLTVILANRQPLEQSLGADLIYFNETFKCFLMVQYKAMEKEGEETVFRLPDSQLSEEIKRMNIVFDELQKCPANKSADGFRISDNPFFLKMCPRIVFDPDNVGMVKGMYFPLAYWQLLESHPTLVGPQGGRLLSYSNARRYFDNTAFVTIASGGWIGSTIEQSAELSNLIRSSLESGRAVILAVNTVKDTRHRMYD